MYLFISENGTVYKNKEVEKEELACSRDGTLTIIDCSFMLEYNNGEWVDIPIWKWGRG